MSSFYWIKLYHEILDDPKMGMLPDSVWRRAIELFLLAGQMNEEGELPCTNEIAWHLRQNPDRLQSELDQLEAVGIITKTESGWTVTNFVKRQAAVNDAERMRQYRERKRKEPDNNELDTNELRDNSDDVTVSVTKRNTDKENTDTETETETELENAHANDDITELLTHFEDNTGIKSPKNKQYVDLWLSDLEEIHAITGQNLAKSKFLMTKAKVILQAKNYNIARPGSLINTCRSLWGEQTQNGARAPTHQTIELTDEEKENLRQLEAS